MKRTKDTKASNGDGEVRIRLAWFAGVDLKILEKTPAEISFYNALGAGVLLLACASGYAATLAVGYMLQKPPGDVWPIGLAWAVILAFGIERLILQVATNRSLWLLLVLVPRVVLSLTLAVQLGEPLVLRIHEGEINNYLSNAKVAAERSAEESARDFYTPKIKTETQKLVAIGEQETRLHTRIANYERLGSCETGAPAYCVQKSTLAADYREKLQQVEGRNEERVPRIEGELERLRGMRQAQLGERESEIGGGEGLAARESALSGLASANTPVAVQIWVLRILFLCLDLLPLTIKVLRMLTVESPYDEQAAAERHQDGLPAKELEAKVRVEEARIEEQERVDTEVGRAEANIDAARRMGRLDDDAGGEDPGPAGGGGGDTPRPRSPGGAPVPALGLGRFVSAMEPHEALPVAVPPELRRSATIGVGLIAGLTALLLLWSALGHAVAGVWLALTALALALGLMAYTQGFRLAPAWALRGALATFFAGLLLPLAVAVVNL